MTCAVTSSPTKIIITGGQDSKDKVSELDLTTGAWFSLPKLPRGRMDHGCTVVTSGDHKYLVVAGGNNGQYPNDCDSSSDILDLNNYKWFTGGQLNIRRNRLELLTVNNRVVLLGGETPLVGGTDEDYKSYRLTTVEELALETWTWSVLDVEMKEARTSFSAVVVPKEIV